VTSRTSECQLHNHVEEDGDGKTSHSWNTIRKQVLCNCFVSIGSKKAPVKRMQLKAVSYYTNIDWCRGQHWKIMPRSCAMLPKGHIFQCWSTLMVNNCFVISRNKCNRFVSSSMMQQHRIRIDLPNTAVGPKNRCKCMVSRGLHHVPREHDHVMPCSRDQNNALTKPGNIVYFCTSRDACWTNHNRVIQIVITIHNSTSIVGQPRCINEGVEWVHMVTWSLHTNLTSP